MIKKYMERIKKSVRASIVGAICDYRRRHMGSLPDMIVINHNVFDILRADTIFPLQLRPNMKDLTYQGIPIRVTEGSTGAEFEFHLCEPAPEVYILEEEPIGAVENIYIRQQIETLDHAIIPKEEFEKLFRSEKNA